MLSPRHQRPLQGRGHHRRGPWRSFEAVEYATLTWVEWYNKRRLLEPIGNIPPADAEERCYAMLEKPAMAA
jgi:transposase InsO family protein